MRDYLPIVCLSAALDRSRSKVGKGFLRYFSQIISLAPSGHKKITRKHGKLKEFTENRNL